MSSLPSNAVKPGTSASTPALKRGWGGISHSGPAHASVAFPPVPILIILGITCVGSLALLPVWAAAWRLWANDPLRSIGALFPLLALLGLLRAWRELGWRQEGSWWGLAPVSFAIAAASLFSAPMLLLFLFGGKTRLLHPGMALFVYGAGAAWLFGGTRLLRRSLAPLCLLLLIDPVPHFFNKLLDLPMQTLSANTARAFAHLIGLKPTGEQLRMMFAPNFGMFIVPGCSGIRGAITFGYLALIFGYVRRLPPRILAAFTVGAVLTGYLFNLIRLCVLVLYYRAGLTFPSIRDYGTQADYVIGATLFLLATMGTGFLISVWQFRHEGLEAEAPAPVYVPATRSPMPRMVALATVSLAFLIPQARSFASAFHPPLSAANALAAFPHQVGPFALTGTYQERDATGQLMFLFGDYVRAGSHERLSLGVYLASEDHYVILSKLAQGIHPEAQGTLAAATANAQPVHLFTSFYHDEAVPPTLTMDAETSCRAGLCDLNLAGQQHAVGLVSPHLADLLVTPAGRRVPLLVRETVPLDGEVAEPELRRRFEGSVREFMAGLNVKPLLDAAE